MAVVKNILNHRFLFPKLYNIPAIRLGNFQLRCFHESWINPKLENSLRNKDDVSTDYKLIYRAPLRSYVKVSYGITFVSISILPTALGSMLLMQEAKYPIMLGDIELVQSSLELLGIAGGLLIVIAQIALVAFNYPFRMYHNSDEEKYIAMYQHILPWQDKKEEFNLAEFKKTQKSILPWKDSLYEFRNKKAILIDTHFFTSESFNHLTGVKPRPINDS